MGGPAAAVTGSTEQLTTPSPAAIDPQAFDADVEAARLGTTREHALQMKAVVDVLEQYRLGDRGEENLPWTGKKAFFDTAINLTRNGEPLLMTFPAFPCKSPNTETKVLGQLPDEFERVSMTHLGAMLDKLNAHYPGGVNLTIVSDGFPFNDLLGVSDAVVEKYYTCLKKMTAGTRISWLNMNDFIKEGETMADKRQVLGARYPRSDDALDALIRDDVTTNRLYANLKLFFKNDLGPIWKAQTQEAFRLGVQGLLGSATTGDAFVAEVRARNGKKGTEMADLAAKIRGGADLTLAEAEGLMKDGQVKAILLKSVSEPISARQIELRAGEVARKFILRNEQFNQLVASEMPPHIRLSCHPQPPDAQKKLGIDITGLKIPWGTPWHACLVVKDDGQCAMARREQAEKANCVLVYDQDGAPSHFAERRAVETGLYLREI